MTQRIITITPKDLEQVIKNAEDLIAIASDEELPVITSLLTKLKSFQFSVEKLKLN